MIDALALVFDARDFGLEILASVSGAFVLVLEAGQSVRRANERSTAEHLVGINELGTGALAFAFV